MVTDLKGKRISGRRAPSSELAMHLLIYRRRPDIHAVCHAHPPTATGYAAARMPLNQAIISEVVLSLGCIPVAPYATPGTPELTEALAPLVQNNDALLMANHGVVTYGQDLLTAFFRMETVEHFAQVSLVTELLGKQVLAFWRRCGKIARGAGPLRLRHGVTGQPGVPGHIRRPGPAARKHHTRGTRGTDRRGCAPRTRAPLDAGHRITEVAYGAGRSAGPGG